MSRPARREKISPRHPVREGPVHPRIPGRGPRAASTLVMRDGRGADLETRRQETRLHGPTRWC
jgi:hypothetical protein